MNSRDWFAASRPVVDPIVKQAKWPTSTLTQAKWPTNTLTG